MTAGLPAIVDVAGITLHPVTFAEAVTWIADSADHGAGGVVCTPNADHVVKSQRDEAFRGAILRADLRVPDGMWIVYAARIARRGLRHTVTGRLLLPAIAAQAVQRGWGIALYGAGPGVADEASAALQQQYPGLRVLASICPPYPLEIGSAVDLEAVRVLRESGARVVFIGLGAPKQEVWMQHHREALPGVTLVGVGAALDIVAGRFKAAPQWMTRLGLEWAFRLAQEPRRLARRYLVDDPWIIWWALRERMRSSRREPAARG